MKIQSPQLFEMLEIIVDSFNQIVGEIEPLQETAIRHHKGNHGLEVLQLSDLVIRQNQRKAN